MEKDLKVREEAIPMQKSDADLVNVERLTSWLANELPGGDHAEVRRLGAATGIGNALFLVKWHGQDLVLRRPPAERITASAGDTARERRLLRALAGTNVRHPRYIASCDDAEVIGAPFLLMEHIGGITLAGSHPDGLNSPDERHRIGIEAVDALSELALVDWEAGGLAGFGKPDNFLERQVDRWLWQLNSYATRELPHLERITAWLRKNRPETQAPAILHGDYSLFNVMFAPEPPARLVAIVDWDTATIGDPLMDLGHLLARWDEPGEHTSLGSADIPDRTNLATRRELAQRYADNTGWDLESLPFYEVLSLFKLACIMEGHYAKSVRDDGLAAAKHVELPGQLLGEAAAIADGERV
jgi:aminoglycoside phosphotransferase (APT) family kinase protein